MKKYLVSLATIGRLVTSKAKRGSTVQDYMRALQDRFDALPPNDNKMKEEADLFFRGLCSELECPERKQLIRLVDVQDARREKTALNSFISGFRLAWGIFRELTDEPLYSFEQEQEERARKMFIESLRRE